jgi:hypothetical protein
MADFKMPEGTELSFLVYLIGTVEGNEVEIVITLSGLTVFTDKVNKDLQIEPIIKSYKLDELGTDWRVMTRDEIKDYKAREAEDDKKVITSVPLELA